MNEKIVIKGGIPLKGTVDVTGAKTLRLLFCLRPFWQEAFASLKTCRISQTY